MFTLQTGGQPIGAGPRDYTLAHFYFSPTHLRTFLSVPIREGSDGVVATWEQYQYFSSELKSNKDLHSPLPL